MMRGAALYMLDTNTVSHAVKVHPIVAQRVVEASMASLCVSAITAGVIGVHVLHGSPADEPERADGRSLAVDASA